MTEPKIRPNFESYYNYNKLKDEDLISGGREDPLFQYIKEDIPDLEYDFYQNIVDEGIETIEQWEDAYVCSIPTTINCEAQFVEQLIDDLGYLGDSDSDSDIPEFLTSHIDWQEVWDCELSHDYFALDDDSGTTHFFSRYF